MAKTQKVDVAAAAKALALKPIDHVPTSDEEVLAQEATRIRARAVELSGLVPNEFDLIDDEEKAAYVDEAAEQLAAEAKGGAKVSAEAKPGSKVKEGLVRVAKDGTLIDVDRTTLDAHLSQGWKLVKQD